MRENAPRKKVSEATRSNRALTKIQVDVMLRCNRSSCNEKELLGRALFSHMMGEFPRERE